MTRANRPVRPLLVALAVYCLARWARGLARRVVG